MMDFLKKNAKFVLLGALLLATVLIWSAVSAESRGSVAVAFLDVGQGDSIFIEGPSGAQVLIDGGANRLVLEGLSHMMPFYDRTIDVVIATHPDLDHIGGLVAVAKRYDIGLFMESGLTRESEALEELRRIVEEKKIPARYARAEQKIILGDGAFIEILFPDRDVTDWESNTASVVTRLVYGDTAALLTGDAPSSIEKYLAVRHGRALESDILKLGHHGSHTSSASIFLSAVSPEIAVVSAGKDNRHGHPHAEVIERVQSLGAEMFSTAEDSTVIFELDGEQARQK